MQVITDSDDATVTCPNCLDSFDLDTEGLDIDTNIKVECPGCCEMVEVMIQSGGMSEYKPTPFTVTVTPVHQTHCRCVTLSGKYIKCVHYFGKIQFPPSGSFDLYPNGMCFLFDGVCKDGVRLPECLAAEQAAKEAKK